MSNDIQRQTTVNIQEKANLIWAIADKVVGVYKPHEYGNVILPNRSYLIPMPNLIRMVLW